MDAARAYQRDSSAYVEQHFGAVIDDASQSSSGPANDSAVAATFTAPTMDLAKAANPSPIEQPIARIKFVPRPAHGLFPGISATYHNDLIPPAVWETPQPVLSDPEDRKSVVYGKRGSVQVDPGGSGLSKKKTNK